MLDAGCGTGNYSKDLLEMGLGHVTMLDASEGMLNKARVKMEPFKDKVTIKQGVLPDLPFPNGTFDMVMFNLVSIFQRTFETTCPSPLWFGFESEERWLSVANRRLLVQS